MSAIILPDIQQMTGLSTRMFAQICVGCKIGTKIISHRRYVAFQMVEVTIPRNLFVDILRLIDELQPPTDPAVA